MCSADGALASRRTPCATLEVISRAQKLTSKLPAVEALATQPGPAGEESCPNVERRELFGSLMGRMSLEELGVPDWHERPPQPTAPERDGRPRSSL